MAVKHNSKVAVIKLGTWKHIWLERTQTVSKDGGGGWGEVGVFGSFALSAFLLL